MDQHPLPQDFKDLLNLLHAHGVKYLLIGGWAVGYHGYPRNTADIDIWIAVDPENAQAIAKMLREFIGTSPEPEDFLKTPYILRMGVPPNRVELTTHIEGVEFANCFENRVCATIEGLPVTLIGLWDLLKNKRAAAREKDISDVKALERFHNLVKPNRKTKK